MDIRIKLNVPKIPLLSASQARAILQQEVGRAMVTLTEMAADYARQHVAVDRGIVRSSIFTQVDLGAGPLLVKGVVATGKQAPHAIYLESGTRPHWVPIAPLRAWARRVLGDEQAAYAVQRAIARRGTPARPFMAPALEHARPQAVPLVTAAAMRAAQRLGGTA